MFVGSPGSVLANASASGGKIYGYNNISEFGLVIVAQPNPQRQKIVFFNPGTQDLFIAPLFVQNVLGTAPTTPSNVALVPSLAARGGCIKLKANNLPIELTGEVQGGWQAFADVTAGANNALTVIESNS
jgi:hypothetical protein